MARFLRRGLGAAIGGAVVNRLSACATFARRSLPPRARWHLRLWAAPFIRSADRLHAAISDPTSLGEAEPILRAEAFKGGPLVLVTGSLGPGGAERQLVNVLLGLQSRGLERQVGLMCLRLDAGRDFEFFRPQLADFQGFVRDVGSISHARSTLGPEVINRLTRRLAWLPADARMDIVRFAGEFARLRPAMVHVWQDATNITAGFAAAAVGVPRIILSTRSLNPTNFGHHRAHMWEAYRQLANIRSVVLVNNSQAGAADYVRWLALDPSRFVIKRNGLDPSALARRPLEATQALRASLDVPRYAPLIGSVFRFSEEKRPLLFVETFAKVLDAIPDAHAVVFGSGPMEGKMRRHANRLRVRDRLHLPGMTTDIALAYSALDVFLLTSRVEGTPNTILEASLLGVPVIAPAVGGISETIQEGVTGFAVPENQSPSPDGLAAALAARVIDVLRDRAWRNKVLAAGPEFVRDRYGLDRMIDECIQLYEMGRR